MQQNMTKIDANFLEGSVITRENMEWIALPDERIGIHGLAVKQAGKYFRLPEDIIDNVNEGVCTLARHTAGGRVRFATDSGFVAFRAKLRYTGSMSHMPLTGSAGADLFVNGRSVRTFRPENDQQVWFEGESVLPEGEKEIEIGLPLYNGVEQILIGVEKGCRVAQARRYTVRYPVVYYGSSITQGGCASKPSNSYEGFLSRWLDADQINLGFSGNGKGERIVAEYIAGLNMSAFVLDYDYNAPTPEHLESTHGAFFDIVRKAQPDLPILLVSRPPRGTYLDEQPERRREIIYATYRRAVEAGDEKVWFVDGQTLFGDADIYDCTMDGVHPNDLGFYRMAQTLYPVLKQALGMA